MGFFDFPAPVFDWVESLLTAFLPDWARLSLWAVLGALLTMVLYKKLSNQDRIHEIKGLLKASQAKMADFDGEMSELMPLVGQTLKLAFSQFRLALIPALLCSLPLIFVLVWASNTYSNLPPAAGDTITISAVGSDTDRFEWSQPIDASDAGVWQIAWPHAGEEIRLLAGDLELLTLPTPALSGVVHKRQWWNYLIGNPSGYLPKNASPDALHIHYTSRDFLPFGPHWMRGWLFLFFSLMLIFSIAFKFLLKIA